MFKGSIPAILSMLMLLVSIGSLVPSAAAEEQNPLENISTVTAVEMLSCMDEGHGPAFCFAEI
ncbi:MAG: hypothetical protein ABJ327_12405 [Litoreibacter sp.]